MKLDGRFATSVYASPILNWRNVLAPFIGQIREAISNQFGFLIIFLQVCFDVYIDFYT